MLLHHYIMGGVTTSDASKVICLTAQDLFVCLGQDPVEWLLLLLLSLLLLWLLPFLLGGRLHRNDVEHTKAKRSPGSLGVHELSCSCKGLASGRTSSQDAYAYEGSRLHEVEPVA